MNGLPQATNPSSRTVHKVNRSDSIITWMLIAITESHVVLTEFVERSESFVWRDIMPTLQQSGDKCKQVLTPCAEQFTENTPKYRLECSHVITKHCNVMFPHPLYSCDLTAWGLQETSKNYTNAVRCTWLLKNRILRLVYLRTFYFLLCIFSVPVFTPQVFHEIKSPVNIKVRLWSRLHVIRLCFISTMLLI